jgi:hypothetical protein
MKRVIKNNKEAEVLADVVMILSLPQKAAEKVGALALLPGLGETWRLHHALDFWKQRRNLWFLFPGLNTREKTWAHSSLKNLQRSGLVGPKVIFRQHAEHTRDQAEWLYQQANRFGIKSFALFVPPYHASRAYLTVLKTFLRHKKRVAIIPVITPVSPSKIVPEIGVSAWQMVPGELARIRQYRKKGDVATHQELVKYLDWLWRQPAMK